MPATDCGLVLVVNDFCENKVVFHLLLLRVSYVHCEIEYTAHARFISVSLRLKCALL
jgi:hypothetical protein